MRAFERPAGSGMVEAVFAALLPVDDLEVFAVMLEVAILAFAGERLRLTVQALFRFAAAGDGSVAGKAPGV